MSSAIQDTIRALVEFESTLDQAKSDALETSKVLVKNTGDWAANAKDTAMAKAQRMASERLAKARSEAEREADSIRKKGNASLRLFETSIQKRKAKAIELVVARLLGEGA